MSIASAQPGLELPKASLDQAPDLESYLERASALELASRSLVGAPVYTVISLIMLLGTPIFRDYGWAVACDQI